jgi:hypothetical protein
MRPVVRKSIFACTRIALVLLGLGGAIATLFAQSPAESHSKLAALTVRTLDAGGQALAGARIALVYESGTEVAGLTGNDGSYRFSRLEPGKYGLRAGSRGFVTARYSPESRHLLTKVQLTSEHAILTPPKRE